MELHQYEMQNIIADLYLLGAIFLIGKKVIVEYISQFQKKKYSESAVGKIIKALKQFKSIPLYDDKMLDEYYLTVIESVIAGKSLYLAQNAGCFRYSSKDAGSILILATLLLSLQNELSLSARDVQFLNGIHHIKKVYELEKQLTNTLRRDLQLTTRSCNLHGVQFSCILTLCAYVEHLVVSEKMAFSKYDSISILSDKNHEQLADFSIEEIISGLSLIISIHSEMSALQDLPSIVFPEHVLTKRYEKMLLTACRIRFLQELQQANEQFGYHCEFKNGVLYLQATSANQAFLQDYRLGYIKRQLSTENYYSDAERPSFQSIIEQAREVFILEKAENPPRYRLRIPEKIFELACTVGELTREENDIINFETQELNLNNDFYNKPIYKDLTLLEYIQLRRFFLVFYHTQVVQLYKMYSDKKISKTEYFQSLIPNLNEDIFECLRPHFGAKLDAFWELNNYKKTNSKIIDLLYQPVLSAGNQFPHLFYALCSIATISNIGRNLFVLLKRFNDSSSNDDGTIDPLIKTLSESFDAQKIPHVTEKPLGNISDIDFAFLIDNTLFVAECKRNIHPTDIFECRTTIDAIHKAERQLDRIICALSNPSIRDAFLQQFGLKRHDINIIPFIITGNRIFSNTNEFRYPVRHFRELIAFVESGTINIGGSAIYLRKGPGLCEDDMYKFLDVNSPFRSCFAESMIVYHKRFKHAKLSVCIDDYALNICELNKFCKTQWNASPLNPEFFEFMQNLNLNV